MTINEKLAKIQTKFKSKKSRFNSFGKYYFRSAEDILEAIKPFIKELGVTVVINEELVDTAVIKTTATITDGKETINSTAVVGVDLDQKGMQMPQRYGSASSYGKKYALGNLFLIVDTQDSDATNTHGKKSKNKLTDIIAAKNYIVNGGKLDTIKNKYDLTAAQEKELNTL